MGMFQKIKAYLNEDDAEYDALIEEQERMREERRKRRNQSLSLIHISEPTRH